jgi:hypothetical protein
MDVGMGARCESPQGMRVSPRDSLLVALGRQSLTGYGLGMFTALRARNKDDILLSGIDIVVF